MDNLINKAQKREYRCLAIKENDEKCLNIVSKYGERCGEHKNIILKYYYGFYPEPPVFVDNNKSNDTLTNENLKDFFLTFKTDKVEIKIRRDGLILVSSEALSNKIHSFREKGFSEETSHNWSENEQAWEGYLKIFNIINVQLECAQHNVRDHSFYFFQLKEISRKDVTRITFQNNIARKQLWYGNEPVHSFILRANLDSKIIKDRGLKERLKVPSIIFEELLKLVEITDFESDNSIYFHDLGRILCRFHEEDYRGSFLLGWIFLEEYFVHEWSKLIASLDEYLIDGRKRINKRRRQRLEGLDYTISVIIEQLELMTILSFEDYSAITELRVIRNDIIHKGYRPIKKDATKMINVVRKYFEDKIGYELKYHANIYGSSGL